MSTRNVASYWPWTTLDLDTRLTASTRSEVRSGSSKLDPAHQGLAEVSRGRRANTQLGLIISLQERGHGALRPDHLDSQRSRSKNIKCTNLPSQ